MADGGAAQDLTPTPGHTIGPFFHYALPFDGDRELAPRGGPRSVRVHGFVYDGDGVGIQDALLEIRQADELGRVATAEGSMRRTGADFTGWGRSTTDPTGHYWFSTVEPGPTTYGGAAFIAVTVFARGLLNRQFTRMYMPTNPEALAMEPLLASLEPTERTGLVARREADGSLRFDIHLQGEQETVFLTFPRHPA